MKYLSWNAIRPYLDDSILKHSAMVHIHSDTKTKERVSENVIRCVVKDIDSFDNIYRSEYIVTISVLRFVVDSTFKIEFLKLHDMNNLCNDPKEVRPEDLSGSLGSITYNFTDLSKPISAKNIKMIDHNILDRSVIDKIRYVEFDGNGSFANELVASIRTTLEEYTPVDPDDYIPNITRTITFTNVRVINGKQGVLRESFKYKRNNKRIILTEIFFI